MPTSVVEILPATVEHAAAMAPHMRQADRDEVWASALLPPEQALNVSVRISRMAWAGFIDGELACLFGVAGRSLVSEVGIPWLLGTDLIARRQVTFLRQCRGYVAQMQEAYPVLINYVDDRNTVSQRWLSWLGFRVLEPEPHGPLGMPFRRFYMMRGA